MTPTTGQMYKGRVPERKFKIEVGGIMIDIIAKINNKEITEHQAYDILDEVIEKHNKGEINLQPSKDLNMDNYEWTALERISRWDC